MKNLNETYYQILKEYIEHTEQNWRNKTITHKQALEFFKEKQKEVGFFLRNNPHSTLRIKFDDLSTFIYKLIQEVEEEMKTIYILRTDKTKMIACADESLVQKCIARLGKDTLVTTYKMKICQTEEDLESVLLED